MEEEIWKIVEYRNIKKNMYEVSNMGRIRNRLTGHIMTQCPSEKGYLMTIFRCDDGRSRSIKTHRVVAIHFVNGRTDIKNEVDHVDGNKNNNRSDNLEWVSRVENIRRGYEKGLIPVMKGSRNGNTELTDNDVRTICSLLVYYCGNCKKTHMMLMLFGVNTNLGRVHDIKYKKVWSWISDEYFTRESISEIDNIPDDVITKICEYIVIDDGDIDSVIEDLRIDEICISDTIIRNIRDGNSRRSIAHKVFKKYGLEL